MPRLAIKFNRLPTETVTTTFASVRRYFPMLFLMKICFMIFHENGVVDTLGIEVCERV